MKLHLLLTLIAMVWIAVPAAEAGDRRDKKKRGGAAALEKAQAAIDGKDQNRDGKLSAAELGAGEAIFLVLDRDRDGFLTAAELVAYGAERRARRLGGDDGRGGKPGKAGKGGDRAARLDADGDGRISADEWKLRPEMFQQLDKDGDGFLNAAEMEELRRKFGGREGRGGQRGRDADQMFERLKQMDADGDGNITAAEFQGPESFFKRLDQDGDGTVTKEELKALKRRARRGGRDRPGRGQTAAILFRVMDRDRDGAITKTEWTLRADLFAKLDINGDGAIRMDEIAPEGGKRAEEPGARRPARKKGGTFIERHDLNGDGKVTRDEFDGPPAAFERRDHNHDGVVDAADGPRGD